jgi:peptide/nickel transport system permease protein
MVMTNERPGVVSAPAGARRLSASSPRLWLVAAGSLRTLSALGRAVAIAVPVLLIATILTFLLGSLTGQDPASTVLGDSATPADIARMRAEFGLDKPLWLRYVLWLGGALHGDLGVSWFTKIPVTESIVQRLPVSLSVAVFALILAVVIGGGLGMIAALNNGKWIDRAITIAATVVSTIPAFVAGIALVVVFAVVIPILPSGGYVSPETNVGLWLKFLTLPAIALSLDAAADIARQLRTGFVGALGENYVVGAKVRGLSRRRVVFVHALRNGAGPALSVVGLHIPRLLGGAVIVETVFQMPGLGNLTQTSALQGDVPVVQGALVVTVGIVLVSSIIVNVLLVKLRPAARR